MDEHVHPQTFPAMQLFGQTRGRNTFLHLPDGARNNEMRP